MIKSTMAPPAPSRADPSNLRTFPKLLASCGRNTRWTIVGGPGAEIVGVIGIEADDLAFEDYDAHHGPWITSLLVHPDFRRNGIAAGLLDKALKSYAEMLEVKVMNAEPEEQTETRTSFRRTKAAEKTPPHDQHPGASCALK
ncbi:unnamed protein product [Amoebophrya sp. A25]|nr:unnamed protein product [Amoebophrya sp. A25]|eukprot:GSA25T00016663001.1